MRTTIFGLIACCLMCSPAIAQDSHAIEEWWPGKWAHSGGDCETNFIEIIYRPKTLAVAFTAPGEDYVLTFDVDMVDGARARVTAHDDGAVWQVAFRGPDLHISSNETGKISWRRCDSRSL